MNDNDEDDIGQQKDGNGQASYALSLGWRCIEEDSDQEIADGKGSERKAKEARPTEVQARGRNEK
jgi:hypothetical protein